MFHGFKMLYGRLTKMFKIFILAKSIFQEIARVWRKRRNESNPNMTDLAFKLQSDVLDWKDFVCQQRTFCGIWWSFL